MRRSSATSDRTCTHCGAAEIRSVRSRPSLVACAECYRAWDREQKRAARARRNGRPYEKRPVLEVRRAYEAVQLYRARVDAIAEVVDLDSEAPRSLTIFERA